jgi:hypothetical protein
MKRLRIVLVKPSKYDADGTVARFRFGLMPNATLYHLASMVPDEVLGCRTEVHLVDEYVHCDLDYFDLLQSSDDAVVLLALVGVQSHQFQRALDLAAFARSRGVEHCVVGGPHPMTCDTLQFHGRGLSFALSEGEVIWQAILEDAARGELEPAYGAGQRWSRKLEPVVIRPPDKQQLERYWMPMLGIYPVRGCPYQCNFCSVIKIAGRALRSSPIETTLQSLRHAAAAGVTTVMFTSDNFNKYPEVREFCAVLADEKLPLRFFCQCDSRIADDPELVEILARAGCFHMFVGVESFDREVLRAARKFHNRPDRYRTIIDLCREFGIESHFSNIIGFPEQRRENVLEHLDVLRALDPAIASFYILCPIPGTEQYDDFCARDLIWETNLDRFDATCPTWRHPHLQPGELQDLMLHCYREFYRDALQKPHQTVSGRHYAVLSRYATSRRTHPMSGGIQPVVVDSASEYRELRRRTFGCDRVPLPTSLQVSAVEALRFVDRDAAIPA